MITDDRVNYITPREYLDLEQLRETKSEYSNGAVVAMAGVSPEHNEIAMNLIVELHPVLKASNCRLYGGEMRVHVPNCNCYYYPDLSAACQAPTFQELAGTKTLENPMLIIEILSPSTERLDRGEKFLCYQTIPTLRTYVLVSQDRPRIECFVRQPSGEWMYTRIEGLDSSLELAEIGCRLNLADIYSRVEFTAEGVEIGTKT